MYYLTRPRQPDYTQQELLQSLLSFPDLTDYEYEICDAIKSSDLQLEIAAKLSQTADVNLALYILQ